MRVIAGTARGKKLLPVPGEQTRPTTDRVKESVFNILQDRTRGARVLDLFAGTGQLGIEALSRGAAFCDFVERERAARAVLEKNLRGARVEDRARLHGMDFAAFLPKCPKESYNLIFLDPPYGGKVLENALKCIERFDILASDGIIICECAADDVWNTAFTRGREYRYGATRVALLYGPAQDNAPG